MELLTEKLLNNFQRDFPLNSMPFAQIASTLETDTDTVLQRLKELQEKGVVSRVGAVFKPNTVGVSTLAAISVHPRRLERTAAIVSSFEQVNHNYEREHLYNLWFVVTAAERLELADSLQQIQAQTGYPVLSLPLVKDYHIDLGFRMQLQDSEEPGLVQTADAVVQRDHHQARFEAGAEDLIEAIQDGLPLVPRPYLRLAQRLGWSEQAVIDKLSDMIERSVIKRLGVVVRHHELGYRANAMLVWDVPDGDIDHLGHLLGQQDCVTLCYQRPRRLPVWPYNLFCMVHGKDRDDVLACIDDMTQGLGLENMQQAVLFSGRRFKQRGACYRRAH